jgi:aldose 1-epimerase
MSVSISPFNSSPAKLYRLTNDNGCTLTLTDLGAAIVGFAIPLRDGTMLDAVLGYDDSASYMNETAYMGPIVGRYANRIAHGSFTLNSTEYTCDKNQNGRHTLHGGFDPWYKRIWETGTDDAPGDMRDDAAMFDQETAPGDTRDNARRDAGTPDPKTARGNAPADALGDAVTFVLRSPDGDQGMPGNARISVTYSLNNRNGIVIQYRAVSDRDTLFNLTNHAYFNLEGYAAGDIARHRLWINADAFTPIDADGIPTGEIRSVHSTALDFTTEKLIGRDIESMEEQMRLGSGFDHNFVINEHEATQPVARARSPKTGLEMTVFTDMPGIQFYSGNMLGSDTLQKGRAALVSRGAFCLETQFFPDAPHHDNFPSAAFKAGQVFQSTTEYRFFAGAIE